jgi:hypothetical protein
VRAVRGGGPAGDRRPGFEEIAVGDVVLAGGEAAAALLIEAVVRLLPGVLGEAASLAEESFEDGLLEGPQFTRPREWEGRPIPDVLLSGDHGKIAAWRRAERRRPRGSDGQTSGRRISPSNNQRALKPDQTRTTTDEHHPAARARRSPRLLATRSVPEFRAGDTVRVNVRIREGERERVQAYEGVVIARAGEGVQRTSRSARSASARAWSGSSPCSPP